MDTTNGLTRIETLKVALKLNPKAYLWVWQEDLSEWYSYGRHADLIFWEFESCGTVSEKEPTWTP